MQELGLPMMSLDTSGSSEYSRMFFSVDAACFLKSALISSVLQVFLFWFNVTTRCTNEPSGVGTRTAEPISFPFSSGMTTPIAVAAPVEVGTMLIAADLDLLMSECGASKRCWSLV